MKRALITGICGQDGSYLAEYLKEQGYDVFGIVRSNASAIPWFKKLSEFVTFYHADMTNTDELEIAIRRSWPDEIYNLAGQVFVPTSWTSPEYTFDVNTNGLVRILKAVEKMKMNHTRIYQASSSEMYGNGSGACDESSPFNPISPYGVAKYAAHRLIDVYRKKGYFAVAGILFNHESPRRGREMVTQKIAMHVAKWYHGSKEVLFLGNMDGRRDWGHSKDYVRAMHAMLQQSEPQDFVVGTGVTHSVTEFFEECLSAAGLDINEYLPLVQTDNRMIRDNEIRWMCAHPVKARRLLDWKETFTFSELVCDMLNAAIQRHQNEPVKHHQAVSN